MKFAVQSVADKLGLTLKGNKNNSFDNVADIRFPEKNCLLYIAAEKYLEKALNAAAVFLIAAELEPRITINNNKTYLFSKQPKLDLVKLLHLIEEHSAYKHNKENFTYAPGNIIINKYSDIAEDALLMGNNYIGPDVTIGSKVVLHPGVVIEKNTDIRRNVIIHANTVIGSDGFGYEKTDNGLIKIPQLGKVEIGSDVEIGSNVSVDRAMLGKTVIGDKVKIDNLVQIAHNVEIGDGTIVIAQVGIGGSSVIGKDVILAGQAGLSDHCYIEDKAVITAQTGIMSNKTVTAGAVLAGSPGMPVKQHHRILAASRQLPAILKKIKKTE